VSLPGDQPVGGIKDAYGPLIGIARAFGGSSFADPPIFDEPLQNFVRVGVGLAYRRMGCQRLIAQLGFFVNAPAVTARTLNVRLDPDREGMIFGHAHGVGW
jgi:hypothetical protein